MQNSYKPQPPKAITLKLCTNCRFYKPVVLFRQMDNGLCTVFNHDIGDLPAIEARHCSTLCGTEALYHIEGPVCELQMVYMKDVVNGLAKFWKFLIAIIVIMLL